MECKRNDERVRSECFAGGAAVMRANVTEALTGSFLEEWATSGSAAITLESVICAAGVEGGAVPTPAGQADGGRRSSSTRRICHDPRR